MPASCTVPDCDLKYAHSEDVSYHKFPLKKPELLAQWIQFTGRDVNWEPTKWSAICSRHFKPSDFKDCIYRKNLVATAVPSIRVKYQRPIASFISEKTETAEVPKFSEENQQDVQSEVPEAETDQEDYSGEESHLLDITCRVCGIVFSKWCQGLLVDLRQHAAVIAKCLPFLNLEMSHFPSKVCGHCLKVINGFSLFYDNVVRAQGDLEHKYSRSYEHDSSHVPTVGSRGMKIKQEPLVNIKEETVDSGAKGKEFLSELAENTLIIKNPNITNDKNTILLFNNQTNEGQASKQIRESKNCEILEIVNLYPPIVDITSATIRELQPYEISMPSVSSYTCQQPAPQIINLKTENTAEMEEEYEDYYGYYQDPQLGLNTLEEHSYSKLPIQADDNKDEIFPHLPEPTEPINLGESKTIRVIHVELPPPIAHTEPPVLKYSCQQCHRKFFSRMKLLKHRTLHCKARKKASFRCLYCPRKFSAWVELRMHVLLCNRRTSLQKRLAAKANAAKFSLRAQLEKPNAPGEYDAAGSSQTEGKALRHNCTMCERSYSRLSNLRRHIGSHRPVDQWNHKCGVCQKIFDKLFDLKKHFQLSKCAGNSEGGCYVLPKAQDDGSEGLPAGVVAAADRLLYVCSTCNKQFKSYNSLKVHESIHTGLKVFTCETCGKCFGGQMNLAQHRLTHVETRQFSCKLCPKVFKRSGGLSQHVKAFHMKIKPYQCPVCTRDFALKADMTRCRHSKLKEFG